MSSIKTREPETKELFICSAIIGENDKVYVWVRHNHCLWAMYHDWVKQKSYGNVQEDVEEFQWFMLADWSFIWRRDWWKLAEETWQIFRRCWWDWEFLYSENLW